MNLSSPLFFVLSSVVGTVLIAAEPCEIGEGYGNYGKFDMVACNYCAKNGKAHGECCNAIYSHSFGRDDDDFFNGEDPSNKCNDLKSPCKVGAGECYPGLTCVAAETCQLKVDDPNAHPASFTPIPILMMMPSSSTGHTNGGHSFVLVVVGLLGAAMIAMTVVLQRRHRGLLRRNHYSEVHNTTTTTTRIDV